MRWLAAAVAPGARRSHADGAALDRSARRADAWFAAAVRRVLRIFFVSSFVSNFVPSVAADLYRAYALSRYDVHLAESTASVLMDRALGRALDGDRRGRGAALRARPRDGARTDRSRCRSPSRRALSRRLIVFSERAAPGSCALMHLVPLGIAHRVTDVVDRSGAALLAPSRALVRVLAMSIAVQVIRVMQAWCLGQALGIELPLLVYFAAIPVIVLIMQVPMTINGLGTTQVAFVTLLGASGADAARATALSLLFLALGVIGSLPGGIIYAFADEAERHGAQPS